MMDMNTLRLQLLSIRAQTEAALAMLGVPDNEIAPTPGDMDPDGCKHEWVDATAGSGPQSICKKCGIVLGNGEVKTG